MIAVALGALIQAAQPSSAPVTVVSKEEMAFRSTLRFEPALLPMVQQYSKCLNDLAAGKSIYPDTVLQATEDRIAACAEERAGAQRVGTAALDAAGWTRKQREREVVRTLDGLDADQRAIAIRLRDMMTKMDAPKEKEK